MKREDAPTILPMFPLSSVLFPGASLPLHVFEPRYRQFVADVMTTNREFGVVLIARGSEVGGGDQRLSIGTVATIEALSEIEGGQFALLARGIQRLEVKHWLDDDPYPRAQVERVPEDLGGASAQHVESALASLRHARALLSELHDTPPLPTDLDMSTKSPEDLFDTHWKLCMLTPFEAFDRQRLLEADSVSDRLLLLTSLCNELASDVTTILARGEDGEML
ncbi:MAG TPA: LON peptidase substrate-binding domain-containing protein [Acidimicrobiales bacterium]|nr:LON peptidase substrate-binding domain-containing protein [Acidimicrobiales bacterium]